MCGETVSNARFGFLNESGPFLNYDSERSTRVLVACDSNFVIAGAAIDGAVILGQEWDLRLDTALCANNRVHFAWGALT